MNLQHRIDLLVQLGGYILSGDREWQSVKKRAYQENGWFIPEFIDHASNNIAKSFLEKNILEEWSAGYQFENLPAQKKIGLVMAGNIPLAGFHDWMSVFISGHKAMIKLSAKDQALIRHLTEKMIEWEPAVAGSFSFETLLNNCDAYIATGSNNSSRYFDYYFGKYPHIIRRNRTSVAILDGSENNAQLEKLADDVFLYFGLGCRNVTKIYVPANYDFLPLLAAFKKYTILADHHKYKNNYDYNLALHLLNKVMYMTNGCILLVEDSRIFSPISQLNYEIYHDRLVTRSELSGNQDLQCIVGNGFIPYGQAQSPAIDDWADGINTLSFLSKLSKSEKSVGPGI